MQISTDKIPTAETLPANVLAAIDNLAELAEDYERPKTEEDWLDDYDIDEDDDTETTEGRSIRACEVPVGDIFTWEGDHYMRISGLGQSSERDYMTIKPGKPCRAVNLTTGHVLGLNKARVLHIPDATLNAA